VPADRRRGSRGSVSAVAGLLSCGPAGRGHARVSAAAQRLPNAAFAPGVARTACTDAPRVARPSPRPGVPGARGSVRGQRTKQPRAICAHRLGPSYRPAYARGNNGVESQRRSRRPSSAAPAESTGSTASSCASVPSPEGGRDFWHTRGRVPIVRLAYGRALERPAQPCRWPSPPGGPRLRYGQPPARRVARPPTHRADVAWSLTTRCGHTPTGPPHAYPSLNRRCATNGKRRETVSWSTRGAAR
jgi:hypothetical protein